jgi:hypothetical protein
MSLLSFNRLRTEAQLEMLMHVGVLLVECKRGNRTMRLFFLHRYYVEVIASSETGKVIRISAFEDIKRIEPYLHEIDLSSLI